MAPAIEFVSSRSPGGSSRATEDPYRNVTARRDRGDMSPTSPFSSSSQPGSPSGDDIHEEENRGTLELAWGDEVIAPKSGAPGGGIGPDTVYRAGELREGEGLPSELVLHDAGLNRLTGGGLVIASDYLLTLSVPFNSLTSLDGISVCTQLTR